jgi:hypothetical protein
MRNLRLTEVKYNTKGVVIQILILLQGHYFALVTSLLIIIKP